MKISAYNFIRNTFSQTTRTEIKKTLVKVRKKARFFYRLRYGNFSAQDLRQELESRTKADFDILMVHCSYNNFSPMYSQGLGEILNVFLEICGKKTLAMPTFFFGEPISAHNVEAYYKSRPCFDSRKAISHTGLLSEYFRRQPGVKRSLHPTQSVCALGPLAERLVSTHHLSPTAFGEGTPFGIMALSNTIILGVGSPYYRCLTQVHAPEDLLGHRFPTKVYSKKIPVTLIDDKGEHFEYQLSLHRENLKRDVGLVRKLLTQDELVEWRYHGVPMFCTTAKRVTEALTEAALRGETIYSNWNLS